ncbi:hypothetical protein TMatcc_005096 [Talaromyces marneffei ATCC 18224]|uniref:Uncharacterized protein n=1 Tax=Talaromyces marneffei (strain ATCC 18224 / CBS 334.59 / QM 7333) TaxID=441960 RepID=B6Q6U4_TALMQ|nr:uncharacterized protein EYB26_008654 [Talaromyces marneffei]EEA26626.1 hypothetical protein PMAA_015500 [Talaromyces marneffei ATCC 18224]KAE8551281.1 hypothetical protein EYB25_007517 [Talaromyces marneffei]QGA20944.1 hypothetical protein EYB26_008654 [Talaromyces marneffei]
MPKMPSLTTIFNAFKAVGGSFATLVAVLSNINNALALLSAKSSGVLVFLSALFKFGFRVVLGRMGVGEGR